jgi:ATP-binding cassette subfamily B protein
VVAAARSSGADAFIAALPAGYRTLLGREFAGGIDLSAGQWQRLAVARAYLREAQIVVLDEPTAALDPRAEVEVYRQFAQAAAGRCAVLISHRLGSARLADRIVVLRHGCIVEEGPHGVLLHAGGEYTRLYSLQAAWYADDATAEGVDHGP